METTSFIVDAHPSPGTRLDVWMKEYIPDKSRGSLQKLIKEGHVSVNGAAAKPRYEPKLGDTIEIQWPEVKDLEVLPQDISLDILFEDEHLIVINKPAGIVVHPAAGHSEGTVVNALLFHCGNELSGIGGVARPGIVHRLDQDTSGCLVVAKNDPTHKNLVEQFASRETKKFYRAIAIGDLTAGMVKEVNEPIGRHPVNRKMMSVLPSSNKSAREAKTTFLCERSAQGLSLIQAQIFSGRTHQIRVHAKYIGVPILGDSLYGDRQNRRIAKTTNIKANRQMLHAWKLGFIHPVSKKEMGFQAPEPKDFSDLVSQIFQLKL